MKTETTEPQQPTTASPVFQVEPINGKLPSFREVAYKYIMFAVNLRGGAHDKTATEIGIDRKTLYRRVKEGPQRTTSRSKPGDE